eukprot:COSAG04_NODE_104_length_26097_cov_12.466074_23_plen_195_part_00
MPLARDFRRTCAHAILMPCDFHMQKSHARLQGADVLSTAQLTTQAAVLIQGEDVSVYANGPRTARRPQFAVRPPGQQPRTPTILPTSSHRGRGHEGHERVARRLRRPPLGSRAPGHYGSGAEPGRKGSVCNVGAAVHACCGGTGHFTNGVEVAITKTPRCRTRECTAPGRAGAARWTRSAGVTRGAGAGALHFW